VTEPTYEIVGAVRRFDERDTVFAREALAPGSTNEKIYHEANPHLRDIDLKLSRFITEKLDRSCAAWERAYYQTVFGALAHLALPDCVDGEPAPDAIDLDPVRAANIVKSLARHLGADVAGCGPLKAEWVYSHRGARPFFTAETPNLPLFEGMPEAYTGKLYGDPINLKHKHTVALGFTQNLDILKAGPSEASDLEIGRVYAKSALVACQVAGFIRSLGYPARAHHVRNYCVLTVPVAVDAGLGELARGGHLLHKTYGLNLRLSCVTTDLPLAHDAPVDIGVQEFCERCLKCARTCPAGAIPDGPKTVTRGVRKWQMDAEKCLMYWSKAGAACVVCQVVCPWTKAPSLLHKAVAHFASKAPWAAGALVLADDLFFGRTYKRQPKPDWVGR
jgi:reductive dehalogenase